MSATSAEKKFAFDVVRKLRAAGYEALWAGGCVRDLLMGKEPVDYDVATSATPQQVRDLFGRKHTLAVGASFGVIVLLSPRRQARPIDVATFRNDSSYSDGRHPDWVVFSNAEDDARRRDFTINGMFLDPLRNEVVDYVGGRLDLQRRLIRAIGNADDRIAEDKLRMLRAIRFAARLDFQIESSTREAITRHAGEVALVSGERSCMEIRKTLQTSRAAWAVGEWSEVGMLGTILPEVAERWEATRHEACQLLENVGNPDWLTCLSALLWVSVGANPGEVERVVKSLKARLKFSNEECDAIRFSLLSQPTLQAADCGHWSEIQPTLVHRYARNALSLFDARVAAAPEALELTQTAEWLHQRFSWPREKLDPEPLINGADLIHLGMRPAPSFRKLLDQSRRMQLEGELADRAAALAWLREVVKWGSDEMTK